MELPDHLVGRSVTQICRAADMLCIGIGSVVESTYYRDLNEFDILCRCAWRLRRKSGGLIVADADLFTLNAEEEDGEETLFDEKIGHFLEEEPFLEVTDAAASSAGDLTVELNDDIFWRGARTQTFGCRLKAARFVRFRWFDYGPISEAPGRIFFRVHFVSCRSPAPLA